jgi:hypothetical protein
MNNLKLKLFLVLLMSKSALAFEYKLDPQSLLSKKEISRAQMLFNEAQRLLPPSLKKVVRNDIPVEFTGGSNEKIKIICNKNNNQESTSFLGKATNFFGKQKIILNRAFLNSFTAIDFESSNYSCKHQNHFKEALATLIHETTHVYEYRRKSNHKLPKVSDSESFKSRVFFLKNTLGERSPDPYEFKNYAESFAVNMEYFLLDKNFQCRKPSLYRYFSNHFSHHPFINDNCKNSNLIKLEPQGNFVKLDLKRLYQVQYLLAGPGGPFMSKFGHSMIRLVFCKPGRELGPDCLQDVSHHIVLSYRANTGNSATSYIRGLTGKYPSQLFAVSFSKIMDEYNRGELRDLFSYPLNFTKEQREDFIYHVLEAHWNYSGKYYFVQNNCAVETYHLLTSVLANNSPLRDDSVLTPEALKDALIKANLIKDTDELNKPFYNFPSRYQQDLDFAFSQVKSFIENPMIQNIEDYLKKSNAFERADWFRNASSPKIQMSFFVLEERIETKMNEKISEALQEVFNRSDLEREDLSIFGRHLQLQTNLTPWRALDNSPYGVPFAQEVNQELSIKNLKKYEQSIEEIRTVLKKYKVDLAEDFEQNLKNLNTFFPF